MRDLETQNINYFLVFFVALIMQKIAKISLFSLDKLLTIKIQILG